MIQIAAPSTTTPATPPAIRACSTRLRRAASRRAAIWRSRRALAAARCRALQDVRIGRWLSVESCSMFAEGEPLTCDRECLRLMNLGRRLPSAAA